MDKRFNFKDLMILVVLTLVMLLLIPGCGSDDGPPSNPAPAPSKPSASETKLERITITAFPIATQGVSKLTLVTNKQQHFFAVGDYSNGQSKVLNDDLATSAWQSSDKDIGDFEQAGILTGKAAGEIAVQVTQDGVTSNSLNINVNDAVITDISVTPSLASVAKGQTQLLTATATYSDGTSSEISQSVQWASLDNTTATVSTQGVLTGVGSGRTTITATQDGITSNTVDVDVTNAVLRALSVKPAVISIAKGQPQQLAVMATYSDNTHSDVTDSVTWKPFDKTTVAVTPDGALTAVATGRTTLTATKDNISSNTVGVVVTDAVITDITVTPPLVSVAEGQTQPLIAMATYSDGTSTDISRFVNWSADDHNTATVTTTGLLTGGKAGSTTLTAVKDGITSNTVDIDVTNAVITAISVTPPTVTVAKGQNQPLTATATYSNGTSSDISDSVSWMPVDSNTATVSANGLLSAGQVNTTTLTAIKDGVTSNTVDINVTNAVITAISVIPPTVTVAKGQSEPLTATATYSDGTSSDISASVAWLPLDGKTATVTSNGLLTGSEVGTTTLNAVKDGVTSNTVDVDVTNAVLTAISVTPPTLKVANGQNTPLIATATYSDGTSSNISDSVSWIPADSNTATVTSNGLLTGAQVGTTTLTAVKSGVSSNTVDVDVTNAVITAISVTPPTVNVAKGQKQPLTANAKYSDGTSSDISAFVAWQPLDANTATITSNGLLTGSKVGATTMTAVKDGITSNPVGVVVSGAVITDIGVTPSTVTVAKGHNQRLTANAIYSDGTSSDISDSVSWMPVNSNTATVSADGLLSAGKVGTTTLTAFKDGVSSNTVNVDVTNAVITAISVTPPTLSVAKGQSEPLTATATYSDNTTSDISDSVKWTPANKTTATISPNGLLSGGKVGATTLTAVKDGVTSNPVGVVVTDAVITAISVTPPTLALARGHSQPLTARATYSDGTSSNISDSVTWIPADSNTATVTSNGLLTGAKVGTTTLTAVKNGVSSNTVDVGVTNAVITAISVTPPTLNLAKGQSEPLIATATFSDNTSSDISDSVTWTSANKTTAAITPTGVLSGGKVGTTTITATKSGVTSNIVDVDVTNAVITAISVTPPTVTVARGQNQPLTANATYSDGTSSDISASVAWLPLDGKTATVTSNGLLTGAEVGTTTLSAVKDGVTSNPVGVVVSGAQITAISVSPPSVSVARGQSEPLIATATYSDGTSSDISRSVAWVPVDSNTATVTSNGLLTGAKVGTTTLSAVKDGVSSNTVGVDVTNAVITAISVTPSTVTVARGQNQPLIATATYSDNTSSDISHSVAWLPVDSTTATVTSRGLLSGDKVGTTTVTAVKNGITSNTVDVDVTNAVITAISVTPPTVTVARGQSEPLTANATYSDGTSSDISASVAWLPANTHTATVTSNGLLTGAKVGTTTLSAIKDGVTSNPVGVVVSDAVITAISVSPPTVTVARGHNQALTANANYSDGTSSDISDSVTWMPADRQTATVTSNGLLTGAKVGTTTLSAIKEGVTSNSVSVVVNGAVLTDIDVTPAKVTVARGHNQPLTATATYSDGTSSDISDSVAWLPANTHTATVTARGLLSGSKVGATTLTAVKDGITSNTVDVDVTNAVLTGISVTPPTVTVARGHNQALTATATYSDGTTSDISSSVSWIPVDSNTATITSNGLLTGAKVGTTTLSVIKDGVTSNPVGVVVSGAVITAINVTPTTVTVARGHNQALTANATYSDGTSSDISDSVTWMPANSNTATVTSQGLLSGGKVGTTTLTAVKDGVRSNTVDVDVTNAVITAISVTPPTLSVAKGQSEPLTATATYSDGTSSDISGFVNWTSANTTTAPITPNGLLSGSKLGTSTVTATKNGVTSNAVNVNVTNAILTDLTVTPLVVSVAKQQTARLTAIATYSDGNSTDVTHSVKWTSVNTSTATVTSAGLLTGEDVGQTTVTAVKNGVTSNPVGVVVDGAVITAISVTPPTVTVARGQNQRLTAMATYSDGTSSDISDSVSWMPVDSNTATVSSDGLLSGGKVGVTTLTAVKDGIRSNTVDVDVTNAVITAISVTPPTLSVAKGQSEPLTATATYSDNTSSDISGSVKWMAANKATALITPNGLLSGGKVGSTTLTAMKDGVTSNSVNVDVTNAVITAISVTPPTVQVIKGQKQPLTANATYSDGTSSDISRSVTWLPLDSNTATVTSNGLLTGAKVGTTTLTAVKGSVTSNPVGVVVSDAVITAINVTPPTITVAKGQNQTLTANAIYSDGSSSDISDSVSWMPVDSNTATVTSQGLLSGANVGTTTLTAFKDGVSSNIVDVDVTNAVITAISVTPPALSVAKGQNAPLTATATYSDNTSSDISDYVSWVAVDSNTATVTPSGLLSGSKVGTTTLTAVKDGVTSNSVNVDVTNAVITAISVTPSTVQVAKGQKQPLVANATYSDGTSSNISAFVAWQPLDANTATVTSNGLLTGAKIGTTTLSAVKDGVTSNPVGVAVTDAVITAISVTPPNVTLAKGNNQPLTATATYSDLTSSDISRFVTWTPVDTSTATVTFEGLLTGANVGTTSVTAAKDGVTSNTVNVDVSNAEITALRVTPTIISVAHGQNVPLTATATYSDGTSSDVTRSVTWTSSRSLTSAGKLPIGFTGGIYQIVTVTPQGLLTGVAVGPTALSATINGVTSNIVDVGVTRAVITDIRVTPTRVSVAKGHSQPLTARATYSDGTTSDISDSVTWLPLDSTATVTAQGLLSGSRVGTTTLTAVKDGITSNTVDVDVTNAVITGIRVTPTTLSVAKGHNQPLTATATYSDNSSSDISGSVSWIPVDSNTATVTAHGLLSGADVGTTTVTAAKDGVTSNTVDVDVTNAVMTGLSLHPPAIGVLKGQTQPLTAIATYSDGTSSNISGSVTWWTPVIENTRTATVSAKGLVKGVNQGSSTVTASVNGFTSNSVYINVCNDNNNDLKGKCIDLLNTGNGKLFTNTPSVAYLNSIGLRGVNSIYMSHYYTFTQRNARALCAQYNTKHLGGRTNWRLPTVNELKNELYRSNQLMSWQLDRNYWSSSERTSVNLRYNQTSTRPNLLLAACVSEP